MTRVVATLLLPLFVVPALGGSLTLGDVLNRLETKEKQIRAIQFQYQQEIHFIGVEKPTTVTGEALIKQPRKLRISKKHPQEQITISDGKKMWVYTPSFNQVWVGDWNSWVHAAVLPKGMIPLGNFVEDLRKNFDISLDKTTKESQNLFSLIAIPKTPELGYRLELGVSKESWLPVKTVFVSDTAKIVTTLSHVVENPPAPNSVFSFSIPEGTEIILLN